VLPCSRLWKTRRAFWAAAFLWLPCTCYVSNSASSQEVTYAVRPVTSIATLPVDLNEPSIDRPITLVNLEGLALANNPTLQQARALSERARGLWHQAGRYPNPVVGYQGSEMGNEGRAGQQGAYVGQQIVTAGKLQLDQQAAAQEFRRAQWQENAQQRRVLTDVRMRYLEALGAQQSVDVAEELERVAVQGVQMAEDLLMALRGTRPDVLQAEIDLNEVRITLQNARNQYDAAWRRLVNVIGVPDLPQSPLEGDLEQDVVPTTWDSVWEELLARSPELAAARARRNEAAYVLQRQRAEPVPDLQLQAGVQQDNSSHDTIANVQFGIALPIFNRNYGNIDAAAAEYRRATRELERLELSLRDRLTEAFRRYENARYQVERYRRDILPKVQQNLDLSTVGYQAGEFSFLRVVTARRAYFQTNQSYITALTQFRMADAELAGLLLTGGLNEVPQ